MSTAKFPKIFYRHAEQPANFPKKAVQKVLEEVINMTQVEIRKWELSPEKFKYINAAQAVWITGDFHGAKDLLWRWWNLELIDDWDIQHFVDLRRKTSACLSDKELCEEETECLDAIQHVLDEFDNLG